MIVDENPLQMLRPILALPNLNAEEERELVRRGKAGDTKARDKIITSHARLVVKLSKRFLRKHLATEDVVQAGMEGLMEAWNRFDPDRGFRFCTYASWWVNSTMNAWVISHKSLVRRSLSDDNKTVAAGLFRAMAELWIFEVTEETAPRLAERLGVDPAVVIDIGRWMFTHDASLNVPVMEDSETEQIDLLVDSDDLETAANERIDRSRQRELLVEAMETLTQREREIFTRRRLCDDVPTLEVLAGEFGITRERVRQIEDKAFTKVQDFMCKPLPKSKPQQRPPKFVRWADIDLLERAKTASHAALAAEFGVSQKTICTQIGKQRRAANDGPETLAEKFGLDKIPAKGRSEPVLEVA